MRTKVLILGAGISGLTLGYELTKKKFDVHIIEKSNEVGGLIKTQLMDGVRVDSGPHLFHAAHREIVDYWRSIVGDRLKERSFYAGNYISGEYYDYPVNRENLKESCDREEYLRICRELDSRSEDYVNEGRSYFDYVRNLAGEWLSEKFFTKYPEKLWGISTKDLSARFAPKRIAINNQRKAFHSGPGRFVGVIEGGCGELVEGLREKYLQAGGQLSLGCSVVGVNCQQGELIGISTSEGDIDCRDQLVVSTLPLDLIGNLVGVENSLYYRSCYCIAILVDRDPFPTDYDWLYFPDAEPPFHRAGLQTRFSREGVPDGKHLLCCEIAYTDPPSSTKTKEWEQRSIRFLVEQGFLRDSDGFKCFHMNLGSVYPAMYVGHEAEVARVRGALEKNKNLIILGSLAEYEYSDSQVLTAKAIDLAVSLSDQQNDAENPVDARSKIGSKPLRIFDHTLSGKGSGETLLIGEIGLAHNGSLQNCKELIVAAQKAGFDAVKIQTYGLNRLSSKTGASRYFEETLDQELPLDQVLRDRIFSRSDLAELFQFAKNIDIDLFSTPFDSESVNLLESLETPAYKISSMDLLNAPLLRCVAKTKKPIIVSTGMSTFGDIEFALNELVTFGASDLALLHCVSAYPCPREFSDLGRIARLKGAFGIPVGYSDHTADVVTPSIAVALGAEIIEKHITLDRGLDGPDHAFSLTPDMMIEMVGNIRAYESAMSSEGIGNLEHSAKRLLRRSVYASCALPAGSVLTDMVMDVRSPGDGLNPRHYYSAIGKRLKHSIKADYPIKFDDIDW